MGTVTATAPYYVDAHDNNGGEEKGGESRQEEEEETKSVDNGGDVVGGKGRGHGEEDYNDKISAAMGPPPLPTCRRRLPLLVLRVRTQR